MNSSIKNKIQLVGHVGGPLKPLQTANDAKGTTFSIATNEGYRSAKGDFVENTQWHTIVAWGKLSDICSKILTPGSKVLIQGRLVHRSYTDNGGAKHRLSEIHLNEIQLLQKKEIPATSEANS